MQVPNLLQTILNKHHIKKGGLAVIDQGIFSSSLLVVHILLARWLSPVEYGVFVVAYSILILLQSVYTGFIYEPMTIFGSSKYKEDTLKYLQILIYGHFLILAIISLILISVSFVLFRTGGSLKYSFLGLGIGVPFILFFNLVRRFYYLKLEPQKAALTSTIYFLGIVLSIYILFYFQWLSSFAVFIAISIVSIASGLSILKLFYPQLKLKGNNADLKAVGIDHFKYGKWSASAYLINWIPSNVYFVILPFLIGMEGTGALRALINFCAPMQQFIGALNLLFLPISSRMYSQKQIEALKTTVFLYTTLILVLTLTYWVVLGTYSNTLINCVYKGRYLDYANSLWLIGFLPFLSTLPLPRSYTLRAMERPDKVFLSYILTAFFTVFGLVFVMFWGITGAILGLLISTAVNSLCIFYWYKKIIDAL